MQAIVPELQVKPLQHQDQPKLSNQDSKKSENKKQKQQKKPKEQKPVKQQPVFEIDVKEQIAIVSLVTSLIDNKIEDFKFYIIQLRLTPDTTLALKSILKNHLNNLKTNFAKFIKMIVMIFEYQPTKSVQINQILEIVLNQLKQFYKQKYPHNKQVDQIIVSNFKRISYDQMSEYLNFWGHGFVKNNLKIVQQFVDNLLYSDEKDERFEGLKIIYSVSQIALPEVKYIIKLIKQSLKQIVIKDIDLLLHRCQKSLGQISSQIKTIKSPKADQLVNHIKHCKRQGFIVNGMRIKPYKTPEQSIKSGLMYNFNNNSFDAFENKFKQKHQFHIQIALILFEQSKSKALYFVQKYQLTEHEMIKKTYLKFKSSFYYKQALMIKNSLEESDDFKATQNALFPGYQAIEYLSFSHFGLKQSDVIFVSDVNQALQQADLTLSKSSIIAFDIQSSGGTCKQDRQIIQTIQIATQTKVYVFDVPKLQTNKSFESLIMKLFCEVNDQIVLGFAYHGNDQKSLRSILHNSKEIKNIKLKQVIDLQRNNPVSKGISLKNLVQQMFKKCLSKFQQCSGWNNRPLRKAQLHYAALDSYVLIEIFKRIPKQQKPISKQKLIQQQKQNQKTEEKQQAKVIQI